MMKGGANEPSGTSVLKTPTITSRGMKEADVIVKIAECIDKSPFHNQTIIRVKENIRKTIKDLCLGIFFI